MSLLRRVPVGLLAQARLHQRLALSSYDFKHAWRVSERILRRKLHEKYHGANAEVLRGLNCSMVLAYTRPFCGAQARRAEPVLPLPGKVLRVLTREERQLHDSVMRSRHKFLAHTDADAVALETLVLKLSNGSERLVYVGADRLAPLDAPSTRLLGAAARKLLEVTQALASDLEDILRPYFRVATTPLAMLEARDP
jgi:hypothetical protein